MSDGRHELEQVRRELEVLRDLINQALDRGAGGEDLGLRACANVFSEKRKRSHQLERVTLDVSSSSSGE